MTEIDHVSLSVADFDAARTFYLAALKPLGMGLVMEFPGTCGLGPEGRPFFWLNAGGKTAPHIHLAFRADTRAAVDAFYKAAIAAGARDNGPPGLRSMYHPNYYAAFVIDPDGHNIEAVCHTPA